MIIPTVMTPIIHPLAVPEESLDYLQLGDNPVSVINPLDRLDGYEDLTMGLVETFIDPEYLHFAAKHLLNIELLPEQCVILKTLWTKRMPLLVMTRGGSKTQCLAIYALLRMLLLPGRKVVIIGAGFRQSKEVMDRMIDIWNHCPVLQDICKNDARAGPRIHVDRIDFRIGKSITVAVPLGDGGKIRGLRAHDILADEFGCLDRNTIIETPQGLKRLGECQEQYTELLTGDADLPVEIPQSFVITPPQDRYEIITEYGYSFICSSRHQVQTLEGWKLAKDLECCDRLVFENHYEFPQEYLDGLDEDLAWLIGCLISEGDLTSRHQVTFRNTDKDMIDRFVACSQKLGLDPKIYFREGGTDKRGWTYQPSWQVNIHSVDFRKKLLELGIGYEKACGKKIPSSVLSSPRSVVVSFLSGLFEGDGSGFLHSPPNETKNKFKIAYYSVSEQLCREVQTVLWKLGFLSSIQSRLSKLSDNRQWMVSIQKSSDAKRLATLLDVPAWNHLLQDCFGYERTSSYGTVFDKSRNQWKASVTRFGKHHQLGRYKTQEEALAIVDLWLKTNPRGLRVRSVRKLDGQDRLYDFYLPVTHSFFGNGFRQHNSVPEEIFNVVVQGFGLVSGNMIQKVKGTALINRLKKEGLWTPEIEKLSTEGEANQIVRSGTATYQFNHFAKTFEKWRTIITSRGDAKVLKELFGDDGTIQKGFSWQDYAILRVPYTHLPEGMLDAGIIASAKASMSSSQFLRELCAVFPKDSDGFFRRSLLEACTTTKPVRTPTGQSVQFSATRYGHKDSKYVIGVDPARSEDNACIVVLEVYPDHRRLVYCWSVNKKKFLSLKSQGKVKEDDYYKFLARKIRQTMSVFETSRIVLDSQGGGATIAEILGDRGNCLEGEQPIYEIVNPEEPKATDMVEGLHILEMVNPTNDYNYAANHGMLKDLETRALLFPAFDTVELARMHALDAANEVSIDTYDDLVQEIEDLKDEVTIIVATSTPTGKEHFDVPEIKSEGQKSGRLRKDRYSALLYANKSCRDEIFTVQSVIKYQPVGASQTTISVQRSNSGELYQFLKPSKIKPEDVRAARFGHFKHR